MKPYYQSTDGNFTLYHGDCLEVMPEIQKNTIDLVLTDPPYFEIMNTDWKGQKHEFDNQWANIDEFSTWIKDVFNKAQYLVKNEGNYFIWQDALNSAHVQVKLTEILKIKSIIIWRKDGHLSNKGWEKQNKYPKDIEVCMFLQNKGVEKSFFNPNFNTGSVWQYPMTHTQEQTYGHPTQKPQELIKRQILDTTEEGGVVLDMFMGSGTTAIACADLNRKCIGIEKEEKYCELIVKRYENANKQVGLF